MTKVLVATEKPFAAEAVQNIKKVLTDAGFEFQLLEKYTDKADLLKAVVDVDALIVRSDEVTREVLQAAPNLKIVVRAGAGYDNIDLEAARERKVVVMNTPGQNANAVAELCIGMMIYYARKFFSGQSGTELKGKKLGILGFGYVGKRVSEIAKALGMIVYAYDPLVSKEEIERFGVEYLPNEEAIFSTCQYVSLNFPANNQTKGSINYPLLSKMPKPAVLVNTARKELVNEQDLLKMFAERSDFAYLSDVEPDCKAEISEKYGNRYFFTPKKMGAQTAEANNNAGIAAANQIVNFFLKGDTTFQVNK